MNPRTIELVVNRPAHCLAVANQALRTSAGDGVGLSAEYTIDVFDQMTLELEGILLHTPAGAGIHGEQTQKGNASGLEIDPRDFLQKRPINDGIVLEHDQLGRFGREERRPGSVMAGIASELTGR